MGIALFALLVSLGARNAQASILVGTVAGPGVETIAEINALIADYNNDFGTSLPPVLGLLDKIEDNQDTDIAEFTEGNLEVGDFNFYHQSGGGATMLDIFDTEVNFTPSGLGDTTGFDDLDNPVFAFEKLGGPAFFYYVSKAGNVGWSLWAYMEGLNPSYTDVGVGDSSIVGLGFTRGAITIDELIYQPAGMGGAVSHITFYTAVPEPGSLAMFSIGALILLAIGLLKRRTVRS
jgi:hypothetical protein